MHATAYATGTGAAVVMEAEELPRWDLGDLFAGPEDPRIEEELAAAAREAEALERDHRGRLAQLDGDSLAALIASYEAVHERLGRVESYAQLLFATHRNDPAIARFHQRVRERSTEISNRLLFVTLELNRLEDAWLERALAQSPALRRWRPWLRRVRAFRPHQLADEVERILQEKALVGRSAWVRLFDETTAAMRFRVDGRELTAAEAFDLLQEPERERRQQAAAAISEALSARVELLARITNTLAKDKEIEDRWRGFARPISARNLANEVEDEVVDALIQAVRASYPEIAHRYYRLKARMLGLERLEHYDRNAPLPDDPKRRYRFAEARALVLEAFGAFSPVMRELVEPFFERGWIDAEVRPGKDAGAFCHPTVPAAHPYVLVNWRGRVRDVLTLAHELGHAVHQSLARRQGYLLSATPLTLAETASVFGEQLVFDRLLAAESDPAARRALLAAAIEDGINTVIRQIAFCTFEMEVHERRRQGELAVEELGEIWLAVQRESLGPAFHLGEDYAVWWSYIPHFIHAPFYVYAYAFGDCLVRALYDVWQREPEGFVDKYLALLEAGGTLRHHELLAPFGLDARDPAFWQRGLGVLARRIDALERELDER